MIVLVDQAQQALLLRGAAVGAGFAKQQDVLDIVLDDAVGFVRLAEKACAIARDLSHRVGNLVPEDRGEVVETEIQTFAREVGVQWDNAMPSMAFARQADIAHDDAHAAARHKRFGTTLPHTAQLPQELRIVVVVAQLRVARSPAIGL
jgi:hypothetical protein